MGFWEAVGWTAAGLVALNSAIDALRGVTLAPVRIFRWLRRAIRAVDVILSIPGRLDDTEEVQRETRGLLDKHLRESKPLIQMVKGMAEDLGVVVPKVQDIHYQVNNNGGGSQKDAVDETLTLARDIKASLEEQAHITAELKIPRPKRGSAPA